MGVGMCLYAQLAQMKNKQYKSAITLQCYLHLSDFCSRPQLTQPYNHIIYPGAANIYRVSSILLKVTVVSADITIFGKLFHTFTILGAKENFMKS